MTPSPCIRRILHLGVGAFHRAHQAVVMQDLLDQGEAGWRLAGGNLRGDQAIVEAGLLAQGGAYTLETVSPAGLRAYRRIRALGTFVPHSPDLAGLVALGADPATRIISYTVTEAGYYLDDAGLLELDATDIRVDLVGWRQGRGSNTIYAALAAILDARRLSGAGPVTLLCCDNLRHNGRRSRSGLLQFLQACGARDLHDWTEANTTAPNTMVDRITPRPTPDIARRVLAATGIDDVVPVMAESFLQWVVEDDFCADRPAFERVGVVMTRDVAPYEEAKIRLLNASHSALAWAGALAGHADIHRAVAEPCIRALAHAYTEDAIACLAPSPLDLAAYRDSVLERFGNAALRDTVERVCADSWAKLPGFVVPTLRDRLREGVLPRAAAALPALFLAFLQRWHEGALRFTYRDSALDAVLATRICRADDPVAALCAERSLFGDIASDPRLVQCVRDASARLAALEWAAAA